MKTRGRPLTFDREAALRCAMNLFWIKGFEGTSLADLTQAMEIGPTSLYAAFGSKEALFHEAVALYQASIGREIWSRLDSEPTIEASIGAFLEDTVQSFSSAARPSGCMMVLGAAPAGPSENPALKDLQANRVVGQKRLFARFERARSEGQLAPDFDCHAASVFYTALRNGMSIMARDGADEVTLRAVANGGLRALTGPTFMTANALVTIL